MMRGWMFLRHLLAIALLPFVVTVVVPRWLVRRNHVVLAVATAPAALLMQAAGLLVLVAGLALFVSSLRRFASEGQGTLAPWDPPQALVVVGPYRFVRNPMISGVLLVLVAQALLLQSRSHATWALVFFVMNAIYIPLVEEPALVLRFGDAYEQYRRHVPRLVPRMRPWTPN